jgi:thiol-disulfide isomerase/thioredoxin
VFAPRLFPRLLRALLILGLFVALALSSASPTGARAQVCDPFASGCVEDAGSSAQPSTSAEPRAPTPGSVEQAALVVFWGVGCPHCEEARPFVEGLKRETPGLTVEWVEIRQDPQGRARFQATLAERGVYGAGIPAFVTEREVVVGYRAGVTDAALRAAIGRTPSKETESIQLPFFGALDPRALSLPALTVAVGLVDGVNPCAFYVLVVLLGVLLHVRSRARVALYGGVFVFMSGFVYFLFMSAWLSIFTLAGLAEWVTTGLGLVLLGMGLVNLKELVWFKKGVSLMIPEAAKPGLFRRMRGVAGAASLPAGLLGVTALAFVVNLVELGCTLGLPAMYTRVLSLRTELSWLARTGYLVLYNVAYVVPLGLIVIASVVTLHKIAMTEQRAKVLKGVSGSLLVLFGLTFLLWPETLR